MFHLQVHQQRSSEFVQGGFMELSAKQAIDWVGLQVRIGLVLLNQSVFSQRKCSDQRVNRKMKTVTVSVSHLRVTALTDERPEWG